MNRIWIKLISLRKESSKLKQDLIDDAAEIYRKENSQTRDSIEISKILPGLNIDGIEYAPGIQAITIASEATQANETILANNANALGSDVRSQEIFMREALAGQGITLIFVDEDQLRQDAVGIARQALEFRDRSRLGGR